MRLEPSAAEVLAWVRERWPDRCDVTSRAMKLAEEAGEVVGAVVKMGEGRKTKADLATELAQLVMCVKGLAAAADIDLDLAIVNEWADMQERVWAGTANETLTEAMAKSNPMGRLGSSGYVKTGLTR